jgi:hypothetical protein
MKKSELRKLIKEAIKELQLQERDLKIKCVAKNHGFCAYVTDCKKCDGMFVGPEGQIPGDPDVEPCNCAGAGSMTLYKSKLQEGYNLHIT